MTPTTNDANATATVNGASATTPVTLAVGSNTVTVQVTAQDGVTTQSYTVSCDPRGFILRRDPLGAELEPVAA